MVDILIVAVLRAMKSLFTAGTGIMMGIMVVKALTYEARGSVIRQCTRERYSVSFVPKGSKEQLAVDVIRYM